MTKEQKIEIYSMLLDGATYEECAQKFGVTKQCIQQLFPRNMGGLREERAKKYKYKHLVRWIYSNNRSISSFALEVGATQQNFSHILRGRHGPSKKLIDNILNVTGMTYEEAFSED